MGITRGQAAALDRSRTNGWTTYELVVDHHNQNHPGGFGLCPYALCAGAAREENRVQQLKTELEAIDEALLDLSSELRYEGLGEWADRVANIGWSE